MASPVQYRERASETSHKDDAFGPGLAGYHRMAAHRHMSLKELAPGVSLDEIKSKTEATFKVPNTL